MTGDLPVCQRCGRKIFTSSRSYRKRLEQYRNTVKNPNYVICDECMDWHSKMVMQTAMDAIIGIPGLNRGKY